MHITGIIAEYNPFHNGHKYHLEETRRMTKADYVIAVISGNFMQRGTPAVIDKYTRTQMALENGVDLVLELPLFYAAGSAEFFAHGAVTLLDRLGIVDSLCFGSESGTITVLSEIASLLAKEPEAYRTALKKALRAGHSFPRARSLALGTCLPDSPQYKDALSSPNNILGMEYLKSLLKNDSSITPYTIKRMGNDYHDALLNETALSSASAIRSSLEDTGTLDDIKQHVPASVYKLLKHRHGKSFPINSNDFSSLLHYRLLLEAPRGFTDYMDLTADFSDKIQKNLYHFKDFEQFCELLKSKDMTYSRISRSLLHILLAMTNSQMEQWQPQTIYYARILGFHKDAAPLLHMLKANTSIPLISKLADAPSYLTPNGLAMLEKDIQASHIYDSVVSSKFHIPFVNEYSKQIIIK